MKLQGSTLFWTFLWSLFMGVTAISIGFGAVFPSMNLIAKPFVCPNGKMDLTTQTYNPYPGSTVTTLTWYCINENSGEKTELGIFPMSLYAGLIYGLLLFGVIFIGMLIRTNTSQQVKSTASELNRTNTNSTLDQIQQLRAQAEQFRERAEQFRDSTDSFSSSGDRPNFSADTLARMKELKELRQSNLISEAEYEAKRKEILRDL